MSKHKSISQQQGQSLQSQISKLTADRTKLDRELASLRKQADAARPWHDCLRCGHRWQGLWLDKAPRFCARCHSAGWNTPPRLPNARRPDSPPNPKWDRKRKQPELVEPAVPVAAPEYMPEPASTIQDYAESHPLPAMKPVEMLPEGYLGLPPVGLPPPPKLSVGIPAPPILPEPRFEEPQGEQFARPTEPEPEPEDEPAEPSPEPEQEPDEEPVS